MPEPINDAFSQLVGYLETQRNQQRQREDDQANQYISQTHDLITAPGANPARTAQLYGDLMKLYAQKGAAKSQKGAAGFSGKYELDMPSVLAGLTHGSIPFEGNTTEPVPQPQSPAQQGLMPEASAQLPGLKQFDGSSVLNSSVMIPPEPIKPPPEATGMLSAARDMQAYNAGPKTRPVANQPVMRSGSEMAQEKATNEALSKTTSQQALMDNEYQTLVKMGTHPDIARQAVAEKYGLKVSTANRTSAKNATVDGVKQVVWVDPLTKVISDTSGNPISGDIVFEGTSGAASAFQQHLVQKPDGSYEAIYVPKAPAQAGDPSGISSAPTGVTGKLPPPPSSVQVLAAPGTGLPEPFKVTGTTAAPITFSGTAGPDGKGGVNAMKPIAPEKMSAAGKQALLGIGTIGSMIEPLMQDLQTQGLTNNPIGQSWNLLLAKHGISPGQEEEQLLQLLGVADAYGLRGLMGGRPNMRLMDIVRVHLPQPGDSTQLSWDKLHTLAAIMPKLKQAIIDSETTQIAPKNPYAGQPAGGNAVIPTPPGGKTVSKAQLQQYAGDHKITFKAAQDAFTAKGYVVQ